MCEYVHVCLCTCTTMGGRTLVGSTVARTGGPTGMGGPRGVPAGGPKDWSRMLCFTGGGGGFPNNPAPPSPPNPVVVRSGQGMSG